MSRRFADVGVTIAPSRLQELAAVAYLTDDEWVDVKFALIATDTEREKRHAQVEHARRRFVWWLLFVGLCLVAMNMLVCFAYVILSLAHQTPTW